MVRTASLFVMAAAGVASAQFVGPFTETFEGGVAGWETNDDLVQGPLNVIGSGALDGSAFVSTSQTFGGGGFGGVSTVLRGEIDTNASGGALAGNYLTPTATTFSFDVRHNAGQDITFGLRLASAFNFPAVLFENIGTAASGDWTTISFSLTQANATLIGTPYRDVLANIGNVQIFAVSAPLTGQTVTLDFDNVAVTPTPGAAAVLGLAGLAATRRRR